MKKSAYITFRTSEEIKEALEKAAKEDDRTLSYIINKIMAEWLQKNTSSRS